MQRPHWLALTLGFATLAWTTPARSQVVLAVPQPRSLPAFALPQIAPPGQPLTNEYLHGRIGILEFWFPSCEPCVPVHADLMAFAKRYSPDSVRLLSVDIDREVDREAALAFLADHGVPPYPVVLDSAGFADSLEVPGAPFLVVIDQQGRQAYWLGGVDPNRALPPIVNRLLGRAPTIEPPSPQR